MDLVNNVHTSEIENLLALSEKAKREGVRHINDERDFEIMSTRLSPALAMEEMEYRAAALRMNPKLDEVVAGVIRMDAEIARLRARVKVLKKYAQHNHTCKKWCLDEGDIAHLRREVECTCELDAALKEDK